MKKKYKKESIQFRIASGNKQLTEEGWERFMAILDTPETVNRNLERAFQHLHEIENELETRGRLWEEESELF